MIRLDLTENVLKYLAELDTKRFKQVANKMLSLMADPRPNDSKALTGYPFLRADIGEYRIVYRFDKEAVYIVLIGKRNDDDIYKQLRRMI
jgi:mRNA interferase RelE/StbE